MTLKFIGNCSDKINWNNLVEDISLQDPSRVGPTHNVGKGVIGEDEVLKPIRDAGYKFKAERGNAAWGMYLPNENFSEKYVHQFMNFVGLKTYIFCWISRVNPGDVAPWHWDITDDPKTIELENKLKRFHCHISEPMPGHVLIVEDQCLYNEKIGNTYQWPKRTSWHAGANAGLTPKYLFNIWGQ